MQGNAEQLPVPSASQDSYSIAFGIRNVTHIDAALEEAHRVSCCARHRPLSWVSMVSS